jgi:WD40 repeat protein
MAWGKELSTPLPSLSFPAFVGLTRWVVDGLVTGSWDRTIRFWDPRSSSGTYETAKHSTPERIYSMDIVNNMLVVAMASRLFHIYDVRNMAKPMQERESSLKYMTRSLACMLDGQGMSFDYWSRCDCESNES